LSDLNRRIFSQRRRNVRDTHLDVCDEVSDREQIISFGLQDLAEFQFARRHVLLAK
jgi:hypothetical protein